jgi:hypothetical protein
MNIDELLNQLCDEQPTNLCPVNDDVEPAVPRPMNDEVRTEPAQEQADKRQRLASAIAGGLFKTTYKNTPITVSRLDRLSNQEIECLYAKYEAEVGGAATKSLGQTMIRLYAHTAKRLLPIPRVDSLIADLETDPFINSFLSGMCSGLYHRWGGMLAPLTALLITARHCEFKPGETECRAHVDQSSAHADQS